MDEALSLPTERAATVALRTQQIIAGESGVANTVDPVAGSYFIETLTSRIEQKAKELIETIDRMGGAVRAIEEGYVQREIQDSAYRYQAEIESGERGIVGVNRHADSGGASIPIHRLDPALEKAQVERLRQFRAGRDAARALSALDALETGARGAANLVPLILDAVESRATLGEIADRFRAVFGAYTVVK